MIYLKSFKLSSIIDSNPNAYPDSVFSHIAGEVFVMDRITICYGSNGSGKSSLLNIIANKLQLKGSERLSSYGENMYALNFINYCSYELGEDERERKLQSLPTDSQYLKSEDILYEIKKIQQKQVLRESLLYQQAKRADSQDVLEQYSSSLKLRKQMEVISFSQEKYSNGETSMQLFDQYLQPNQLYLLDEPETSLSPANQIKLAEQINELAKYFDCQFIIATHSPFMLATLQAKIYNLDASPLKISQWYELDNIRYYYSFFEKHKHVFQ